MHSAAAAGGVPAADAPAADEPADRAAEVWRVSELRSLDGASLREAVEPSGALERLVGRGKAGGLWGQGGEEGGSGQRIQ